jgi:hypothetical protein
LNSEKVDLATAANFISATDMAATSTAFSQSQIAIQADLAVMSRISQASLFDYLKWEAAVSGEQWVLSGELWVPASSYKSW